MKRPDLSFITSQKFNTLNDYYSWLSESQSQRAFHLKLKLPELIQIAEMYHDSLLNNQESIVFKMVNKLLNEL